MVDDRKDFYSCTRAELASYLGQRFDAAPFRAVQLFKWVYGKGIKNFAAMTDIAGTLRASFEEVFYLPRPQVRECRVSADGTRKYLFELDDGRCIESVMIRQPGRNTLCISSQAGCGMGCSFCMTGALGWGRNLTLSEIVQQVVTVKEDVAGSGELFQNIVFMGMGEPLHNYKDVRRACLLLTDDMGLNFSARKITVSTVGLAPRIKWFFDDNVPANLAVSLNATTDAVRSEIMPVNKRYPIAQLLEVLRTAKVKRNRRITVEYVLLKGVNDFDADLRRLIQLMRGLPVKINLLPCNGQGELGFFPSSREKIMAWGETLRASGIDATIRWSKGGDIEAACGQLCAKTQPLAHRL